MKKLLQRGRLYQKLPEVIYVRILLLTTEAKCTLMYYLILENIIR